MAVFDEGTVSRLRHAARDILVGALTAAGYPDASSVHRALRRQGGGDLVPARTIERYLDEGPPLVPKSTTREHMVVLGDFAHVKDELLSACHQLWEESRRQRKKIIMVERNPDQFLPSHWYGIIPAQEGRNYASIDSITIEEQSHEILRGSAQRVSPPREQGYQWRFSGTRYGLEGLFLSFHPLGLDNLASRGTIALRRIGYRELCYLGSYTRLGMDALESTALVTRDYGWYLMPPQTALYGVALLDVDNSLREGWSMKSWLAFLARNGWAGAHECSSAVQNLMREYVQGDLTHDDLAEHCGRTYAEMLKGKSVDEVAEAARIFVQNYDVGNYEFVNALIATLRRRWIAPIMVSGAPIELLRCYAEQLSIDEFHGLTVGVESGYYTGQISINPGMSHVKQAVVRGIRHAGRDVVLAVGDSDSDLPLWDAAPNRIIVGDRPPEPEWPSSRTLTIRPGETSGAALTEWLTDALADAELPDLSSTAVEPRPAFHVE